MIIITLYQLFSNHINSKLKPKISYYRSYKSFNEQYFLEDLEKTNFAKISDDPDEKYNFLTTQFQNLIDKHAPQKKKVLRVNHAPFMCKELRKAIYTRSRLKNKFCKNPTKENEEKILKHRNKCVKIRRKSTKSYFRAITQNGVMNNKNFWKVIKPFLTNKGFIDGNKITIVDGDEIISEEKELVKIFNVHYINIVEKTCGLKPKILNQENKTLTNNENIENIKKQYESHPSIIEIKNNLTYYPKDNNISILTTPSEVKKLLKNLDTKKATGVDKIPPKLAKLSADALAIPLSLTINSSMKNDFFPSAPKIASVSPVDKKTDNKNKILNYRPASVLNTFSKIYETI